MGGRENGPIKSETGKQGRGRYLVMVGRCAVRAAYQRRSVRRADALDWAAIPPAHVRARTSQCDIPAIENLRRFQFCVR